MANKRYTWKKGKQKIVCEITPLDEHYLLQREMEMMSRMTLAGYTLQKHTHKKDEILDNT